MKFNARVVNREFKVQHIQAQGKDQTEVQQQLNDQGYTVLRLSACAHPLSFVIGTHTSRSSQDKLQSFNIELLALMRAGLSLIESLETMLEREANAERQEMLSGLIKSIKQGKRFSSALSEQSQFFSTLYVGIIRASEETSDLSSALSRYIAHTERGTAIRTKIVNASIYPSVLLLVGAAVVLFLMMFVIPRFSQVYRDTGRDLPVVSQLLLSWGSFFYAHSKLVLFLIVTGLVFFWIAMMRTGGDFMLGFFKKLPTFRDKVHLLELSRLYMTLAMLLEGGIPLADALHTVSDALSDTKKQSLSKVNLAILEGRPLSSALFENELTTPISLRLLRVGERSGQLAQLLTEASKFHEQEVATWIDRFSKVFEPALMALIGLLVGTIVVFLYMPIFDLAATLN